MNIFNVTNPVIIVEVLTRKFINMDAIEYERTRLDFINGAETFIRSDNSGFSSSLSLEEATEYAAHIKTFLENLSRLKSAGSSKAQSIPWLANAIAWRQLLSTFQTLYGKPYSTK